MNDRESNAASCSPVAARTRKVSGRKIFRKRKEFAPHFKRHFLKWHLRVRVLPAQPGRCVSGALFPHTLACRSALEPRADLQLFAPSVFSAETERRAPAVLVRAHRSAEQAEAGSGTIVLKKLYQSPRRLDSCSLVPSCLTTRQG